MAARGSRVFAAQVEFFKCRRPFFGNQLGVSGLLSSLNTQNCSWSSIDVDELYYSMPQDKLMKCVQKCITTENDEVAFRNISGMSTESFLELLSFYLTAAL